MCNRVERHVDIMMVVLPLFVTQIYVRASYYTRSDETHWSLASLPPRQRTVSTLHTVGTEKGEQKTEQSAQYRSRTLRMFIRADCYDCNHRCVSKQSRMLSYSSSMSSI